jgi:hypothetical protein
MLEFQDLSSIFPLILEFCETDCRFELLRVNLKFSDLARQELYKHITIVGKSFSGHVLKRFYKHSARELKCTIDQNKIYGFYSLFVTRHWKSEDIGLFFAMYERFFEIPSVKDLGFGEDLQDFDCLDRRARFF